MEDAMRGNWPALKSLCCTMSSADVYCQLSAEDKKGCRKLSDVERLSSSKACLHQWKEQWCNDPPWSMKPSLTWISSTFPEANKRLEREVHFFIATNRILGTAATMSSCIFNFSQHGCNSRTVSGVPLLWHTGDLNFCIGSIIARESPLRKK